MKTNNSKVLYHYHRPEKGEVVIGWDVTADFGKYEELVHRFKSEKAASRLADKLHNATEGKYVDARIIVSQVWGEKPMKKVTQEDAIQMKATKLAAFLHRNNKNLTKFQKHLVDDLWDCMVKWDYVKKHLGQYNLDGVRHKED